MKDGFSPELSPKEMLELGVFGGWYFGNDVDELEYEFSKLIGVKHAIGVGSGTDALFLSLKSNSKNFQNFYQD